MDSVAHGDVTATDGLVAVGKPVVARADDEPPGAVLVAAPHPDDEVLGCGGSIARRTAAGRQVTVVFLTSGEHSGARVGPADMGLVREREAAQAAAVLGVSEAQLRFLRFPDGGVDASNTQQLGEVMSVLRTVRPQLLYVPHPGDGSYDHQAAYQLCWRAAGMAGSTNFPQYGTPHWVPTILGYEVWAPIAAPAYYEDVTAVIDFKIGALRCYRSQSAVTKGPDQASHVGEAGVHLAGFRGAATTGGYREAFAVLRLGRVIV